MTTRKERPQTWRQPLYKPSTGSPMSFRIPVTAHHDPRQLVSPAAVSQNTLREPLTASPLLLFSSSTHRLFIAPRQLFKISQQLVENLSTTCREPLNNVSRTSQQHVGNFSTTCREPLNNVSETSRQLVANLSLLLRRHNKRDGEDMCIRTMRKGDSPALRRTRPPGGR